MRKFSGLVLVLALVAGAGGASAEGASRAFTCDEYATGLADRVMSDELLRAGDREHTVPGRVLVIAAGQKFYIPQRQVDDSLAPVSIYSRMTRWNDAYAEGYWRCLNSGQLFVPLTK